MILSLTNLNVIDNSGASLAKVIKILEGNKREAANLGANLVIAVKKSSSNTKVKKGEVHKFRLLRTKKPINRKDGIYIIFDNNGGIILNQQLSPIGSRLFGPAARELKKRYRKISNYCKMLL
jgi:large subunit ribosomal protein L14